MGISIEEFIKLSNEEKGKKYAELSDHDKYLWRTRYEPLRSQVVGHREHTEKEQEESKKKFINHLKKIGVIKD